MTEQPGIMRAGEETQGRTIGRPAPCVALCGVPVVEAMAACVLADALLRRRGLCG